MNAFSEKLLKWHKENPRFLPWKKDKDVYSIWLSEIIMQQTRVSYGQDYYLKFKEHYPTVFDLAAASLSEVMKDWEGLGYYSRARNLHETAKYVAEQLGGEFPKTQKELLQLKGVGPYTSAAIASFAYGELVPAVDGNAYRVLARYFGIETPIDTGQAKKEFFTLASDLMQGHPRQSADFNQAMMNFGAVVCKPKGPTCNICPINDACSAFATNQVAQLPVKSKKLVMKHRWFLFFVIQFENHILIEQRKGKDVWQNLYQFPMIEHEGSQAWEEVFSSLDLDETGFTIQKVEEVKQTLTHQHLHGQLVYLRAKRKTKPFKNAEWVSVSTLNKYPFPKMLQSAVKTLT